MSIFQSSSIGNFTRGGQTAIHFVRMIGQVLQKGMWVYVLALIGSIGTYFWMSTTSYERYITGKYFVADFVVERMKKSEGTMPLKLADGREVTVRTVNFIRDPGVRAAVDKVYRRAIWAVIGGFITCLVLLMIGIRFIYRFGSDQATDEHVRGTMLVSSPVLKKAVRQFGRIPEVTIAGVPMPKGSDTSHVMLMGGSGSGKSTVLKEMLTGVRRRGDRMVVYDNTGDFVSLFYRPGKDVILNPLDARSAGWDLWQECERDYEFDRMAESLIPDRATGGDPFWIMGARIVFSAMAQKIGREPNPSIEKLMHAILNVSIEEITHYVRNTEAASIISSGGERMAISVRGVLATYTKSLKYLSNDSAKFSLRDWIRQDEGDSWVFLTCRDDQRTALRPLITVWMDTAISALSSIPPDDNRRVWFSIDELPTLNKLPSLFDGLAGIRKFGGCIIVGIQSYSQLVSVYTRDGAQTIAGGCASWTVFRYNNNEGAEFASKNLGNSETVETYEGISFGANEIRDGVTLSKQRNIRPIVLPTEISQLPDYHGFLKFGRGLPVGQIKTIYREHPKVAEGFVDAGVGSTKGGSAGTIPDVERFDDSHETKRRERDENYVGNGLNGAPPPPQGDDPVRSAPPPQQDDMYESELV